jgi:hypothetical protein
MYCIKMVEWPINITHCGQAAVVHAFNPSTWEAEAGGFLSSRTARAIQRNPVSKKRKKKKKNQPSPWVSSLWTSVTVGPSRERLFVVQRRLS